MYYIFLPIMKAIFFISLPIKMQKILGWSLHLLPLRDIVNWKDLLSHKDSSLLEDVEVLQNFIVAQYKTRGLSEIEVHQQERQ